MAHLLAADIGLGVADRYPAIKDAGGLFRPQTLYRIGHCSLHCLVPGCQHCYQQRCQACYSKYPPGNAYPVGKVFQPFMHYPPGQWCGYDHRQGNNYNKAARQAADNIPYTGTQYFPDAYFFGTVNRVNSRQAEKAHTAINMAKKQDACMVFCQRISGSYICAIDRSKTVQNLQRCFFFYCQVAGGCITLTCRSRCRAAMQALILTAAMSRG